MSIHTPEFHKKLEVMRHEASKIQSVLVIQRMSGQRRISVDIEALENTAATVVMLVQTIQVLVAKEEKRKGP